MGLVAVVVALAACGPADEQPCIVGDVEHASGDAFTSEDGCIHYVCEDGEAVVDVDEARTIAGDVVVATQGEVDALACTTEIGGSLRITGSAAMLGELRHLRRVGKDVVVEASAVQTLDGLGALAEIDGNLSLVDNAQLGAVPLPRGMSVYGDFTLQNNDALETTEGLNFLGACPGCAAPPPTTGTWRFIGEDVGPSGGFFGNLLVADNDVLADLVGLRAMSFAGADFRLRANASLSALTDLALSEVRGTLEITDHPALQSSDVDAFVAEVSVGGMVLTCGNGSQPEC